MAVSKTLRYQVFTRDNNTCRYCGATAPDVKLVIDHVTPIALGGRDEASNLVTACEPCNSGKSATPPGAALVADVAEDALRWAAAIKQAATEAEADDAARLTYRQAFLDAWNEWTYEYNGKRETFELPDDWRSSVERYRLAGIPAAAWPDLIEPGMVHRNVKGRDVFRYTCGVANNRLKALSDRAKQIVGAADPGLGDETWQEAAIREAAVAAWCSSMDGDEEHPSADAVDAFRRSLDQLPSMDLIDPGRIVAAAKYGGWFGITDIRQALRDMDRYDAFQAWISAWPTTYVPSDSETEPWGTYIGGPADETKQRVSDQIDKLLDAEVHVSRIQRAAAYAGFHKSGRIYCGLTDHELEASGQHAGISRIIELWRVACMASGTWEPTSDEVTRFYGNVRRTALAHDSQGRVVWADDYFEAALWAGAYRDPDISTCLPLHGSVFQAAAALPCPE